MATHSSILAWKIPQTEKAGMPQVHEATQSDETEVTQHAHTDCYFYESMCLFFHQNHAVLHKAVLNNVALQ